MAIAIVDNTTQDTIKPTIGELPLGETFQLGADFYQKRSTSNVCRKFSAGLDADVGMDPSLRVSQIVDVTIEFNDRT